VRLFVAVELDDLVRAAAEEAVRHLERILDPRVRVRWVPTENMHLTVRFIGHVADERVPATLEALRPALAIDAFDLALSDGGLFPPHGPPRALWIGLREGLPSLQAMHDDFNRRLVPLGVEPETRPFSAHLTLARIKDAPRGSAATVREAIRAARIPHARCRISEAVVFESRLSRRGSTYIRQLGIPLRP
jgi:RNA 2',3'-cyclic 3'-phosphodiesterase